MMDKILFWDEKTLLVVNSWAKTLPVFLDRILAEFLVYLVPIILLVIWFFYQKTRKSAMRAFFSVMLAWPVIATLAGKIINRPRPFESGGIKELIFHRPTYSFPSDHAAALAAIAASFWLSGQKKLATFFGGLTLVIGIFRIATGVHWPTDILAGFVVGALAAFILHWLDPWLGHFYELVEKILKKIKLA